MKTMQWFLLLTHFISSLWWPSVTHGWKWHLVRSKNHLISLTSLTVKSYSFMSCFPKHSLKQNNLFFRIAKFSHQLESLEKQSKEHGVENATLICGILDQYKKFESEVKETLRSKVLPAFESLSKKWCLLLLSLPVSQ